MFCGALPVLWRSALVRLRKGWGCGAEDGEQLSTATLGAKLVAQFLELMQRNSCQISYFWAIQLNCLLGSKMPAAR